MSLQDVMTLKDKKIEFRVSEANKIKIKELADQENKSVSQYILDNVMTRRTDVMTTKLIDVNSQFYRLFDFIFGINLSDYIVNAILEYMESQENWNETLIDEVREYVKSQR